MAHTCEDACTSLHICRLRMLCFFVFVVVQLSVGVMPQSIVRSLPGFDGDLPFKLETGYVGVGDLDDVQLFYYFIQSEGSPLHDPLILWLTGGPGCSSLSGLIYEIGPISFNYERCRGTNLTLELNPYSWTKLANVIFLDAPVGTGFSYANSSEGYNTGDQASAELSYQFLRKWLVLHPEFLPNPLIIGGDSYSGKVIPIVTKHISDGIIFGHVRPYMNLKGYIMGNAVTDLIQVENSRVEYSFRVGLISDELYQSLQRNCEGEYVLYDANNTACVIDVQYYQDCVEKLYAAHILEPTCTDYQASQDQLPSRWCRADDNSFVYTWANDPYVQKALHIREDIKSNWVRCNKTMESEYKIDVKSSVTYTAELAKRGYRMLIYSGDQDLSAPYVGSLEWIKSLNLSVEDDWRPWFVDGQVSGYTIQYSQKKFSLTYATVKGGGHTAPSYKPKECFNMVDRWLADYPL